MRAAIRLAALLIVAPTALAGPQTAPPQPAATEHYDPPRLNEQAVARIRRGDLPGAAILLERAALLAPHDAHIRANLRQVRAALAGQAPPAAQAPAASTAPQPVPQPALPPEPPPLWRQP